LEFPNFWKFAAKLRIFLQNKATFPENFQNLTLINTNQESGVVITPLLVMY